MSDNLKCVWHKLLLAYVYQIVFYLLSKRLDIKLNFIDFIKGLKLEANRGEVAQARQIVSSIPIQGNEIFNIFISRLCRDKARRLSFASRIG